MSSVGTGDLSPVHGVAVAASSPVLVALMVRRGGGAAAVVALDTLGGVANGLIVGVALISADRGCNLSGESARRSSGDPGSALFGRLMHFLPGVSEEQGE